MFLGEIFSLKCLIKKLITIIVVLFTKDTEGWMRFMIMNLFIPTQQSKFSKVRPRVQGDQIGRIFAYRAIVFIEKTTVDQFLGHFFHVKSCT
jgi:hypothetical protein